MKAASIQNHIVNWLKSYAENAGVKGFVIGVSGGIDSATTSTLCALTGLEVTVVNMPIHQAENQVDRGMAHMNWLASKFDNVKIAEVPLTSVFDHFIASQTIKGATEEQTLLAEANSRARLRMTTLYYIASCNHALVAGTGNKVEDFGVGFYTKYGDGGVDLSPIADLTKTEVTALGKHLGVSEVILQAPPTDGLWGDDRTDEDQIGASYPELEWAMARQDEGKQVSDFKGREREVFETYIKFHKANRHKMLPIPVCEIPSELR
jgi:NAD+ synthase